MGGRGWVISRLSALRGADNWENADQPGQPHPLLSLLLLGDVTMGWREVSRQAPSPRSPPRLPCTRPVTQFLSNDKESELRECVYVKSLQSYSTLCDPWTVTHQVPLGFSRHEYRNGLLYPPPGDLPNPGIEPKSPSLQADSLLSEPQGKPSNDTVLSVTWYYEKRTGLEIRTKFLSRIKHYVTLNILLKPWTVFSSKKIRRYIG